MFKKITLIILVALGISTTNFSTGLYAEEKHEHKHADSAQQKPDHQNHAGMHWASPKEAAERVNPIKSDKDSIARGAKTFEISCSSCHGATAMGDGVAGALLDPKPVNLRAMSGGHMDGDFAWKIANGRGAMPAWNSFLSENEIWDLVNFIQNLKNEDASADKKDNHEHKH